MPSYNLPQFERTSSSPSPPNSQETSSPPRKMEAPPCPPRPILSAIQPNQASGPQRARSSEAAPASPPRPKQHMRAQSSPPAYLSAIPSTNATTTTSSPPVRRRPLSRRYTRPASLSHLSSRSPLQSHTLPSFSRSHPSSTATSPGSEHGGLDESGSTTLFEELLSSNLERKMRERVEAGKRVKGGEKMGLGGLKPGRELLMWSALNRCSVAARTRINSSSGKIEERNTVEGANVAERSLNRAARIHARSPTVSNLKIGKYQAPFTGQGRHDEEDEDDDDDEPLARKLQEAIEKRERFLVQIQAERARKSLELEEQKRNPQSRQPGGGSGPGTEHMPVVYENDRAIAARRGARAPPPPSKPVLDVQVKIKLPASPKPVFLKPNTSPSPGSATSPSSPLPSPPAILDLGPPLLSAKLSLPPQLNPLHRSPPTAEPSSKRSKRLRKNLTWSPTLGGQPYVPDSTKATMDASNRGFSRMSARSLSLPTVPPKIATTFSYGVHIASFPTSSNSFATIPTPLLNRSRSENVAPSFLSTGGASSRKLSAGMKRSRSDNLRAPSAGTVMVL